MIRALLERRGFWLSAFFGILAFPPIGFWPLAFAAMVPFLCAATSEHTRHPFRTGYWSGFLFYFGLIYWIGFNSGAPWYFAWPSVIAMVVILASVWGFAAWAVWRVNRRHGPSLAALLFVVFYVFQEMWWGIGEFSFPWPVWALSQTTFLPSIQIAELVDWFGVSLWVLTLNALLFVQLKRSGHSRVRWIAAVVFLLPMLYGVVRMNMVNDGPLLDVAAVQANTPAEIKWQMSAEEILGDHVEITRQFTDKHPKLVVWPETATPVPIRYRQWARDELSSLADTLNAILITGATDYDKPSGGERIPYNSCFVFRPGSKSIESAAKVHLVPFGERIPWQKYFPFLGNIRLGQAEFRPGDKPRVFAGETIPDFGCLICFEVVYPEIAAQLVNDGAQILAHITNDGWYGNTSGPYQHLYLSRLRAVAVRRSIVRAANTGISALILPSGEFVDRLEYDRAGYLLNSLPVRTEITPAARLYAFWPPFYTALLAGVLVALWRRRRAA